MGLSWLAPSLPISYQLPEPRILFILLRRVPQLLGVPVTFSRIRPQIPLQNSCAVGVRWQNWDYLRYTALGIISQEFNCTKDGRALF